MNQWYKPGPDHILSLHMLRIHRSTKLPAVCVHTSPEPPEANHRWYFTVSVFHCLSPRGTAVQEISEPTVRTPVHTSCREASDVLRIPATAEMNKCMRRITAEESSPGGINFQTALSTSLRPRAFSRFSRITPWLRNPSIFSLLNYCSKTGEAYFTSDLYSFSN